MGVEEGKAIPYVTLHFQPQIVQFSSAQSFHRLRCRRDLRDDSAETLFQSFLREAPLSSSGVGRDVHSLEEMLDGQHQRVDIPAHARTAHKGLLQKRLEEDLC